MIVPSPLLSLALGALLGLLGVRLRVDRLPAHAAYAWAMAAYARHRARPVLYRITYRQRRAGFVAALDRRGRLGWERVVEHPDRGPETAHHLRRTAEADADGAPVRYEQPPTPQDP